MKRILLASVVFWHFFVVAEAGERVVTIQENQLSIDGEKQPQLFGAELQYFRLRGAYEPNVPRATVITLWNKALDRMVEAKMNAISFYIPWDFHEYAEGKFDFTGSVDEDGDGNADYPSRDIHTFFRLIEEHGIRYIMVRPGPYINAEWGFLGFGAIPEWFHKKFPDSHMRSPLGIKTRLYDYHNPDLLRYTQHWFAALYREVLQDKIGYAKPVQFLQLDNETNFMWQSIYNHDYGAPAIARYRIFLQDNYSTIDSLNRAHKRNWKNWQQIQAPLRQGLNTAEDQDWYRFQDYSMYTYLQKIRAMWEAVGVKEPQVLFTLAESYNAADNGILPNYSYRNAPGLTGMMTVNLYPKTFETGSRPLHNQPFKADLDVLAADEANDFYLRNRQEWVLGPEIQGGWWKGISVSSESRRQTYLSSVGHGMKALFIYYFSEGYNWGANWAETSMPPLLAHEATDARKLYFDAPLDENAEPRAHFDQIKQLGERLFAPYADFLARSKNAFDAVAIVKDDTNHLPVSDTRIASLLASSDWAGGLLGYAMSEGLHPRVLIGELSNSAVFEQQKVLFHIDTGLNNPATVDRVLNAKRQGSAIVNFLSDALVREVGIRSVAGHKYWWEDKPIAQSVNQERFTFYVDGSGRLQSRFRAGVRENSFSISGPLFTYDLTRMPDCEALLYWNNKVAAYRCHRNNRNTVQIGVLPFDGINSSNYANISDLSSRRLFLRALLKTLGVDPLLEIDPNAQHLTAFARHDENTLWITVKSAQRAAHDTYIKISRALLPAGAAADYEIKEPLSGGLQRLSGAQLESTGLRVQLPAEGSTVYVVEPTNSVQTRKSGR